MLLGLEGFSETNRHMECSYWIDENRLNIRRNPVLILEAPPLAPPVPPRGDGAHIG
jgi:hypothetical protein